MRENKVELSSSEGNPLRLQLLMPAENDGKALLVICHGFKGFMNWGFFPFLAQSLAEAGYAVLSFDFSRNGIGDDPLEFTRLDLFEGNTYSQEMKDLKQVMHWARIESPVATSLGQKDMGILGHSRGALPAIVGAVEDPQITSVVTWNGVGKALRYTEGQYSRWQDAGKMEFVNGRTGQTMAMDWGFVEDVRANQERFDLSAQAKKMQAQHLILHGSEDMAVDPKEAELLRADRNESLCSVVYVEGGTHTFSAVHPFEGATPTLNRSIVETISWFNKKFGE